MRAHLGHASGFGRNNRQANTTAMIAPAIIIHKMPRRAPTKALAQAQMRMTVKIALFTVVFSVGWLFDNDANSAMIRLI